MSDIINFSFRPSPYVWKYGVNKAYDLMNISETTFVIAFLSGDATKSVLSYIDTNGNMISSFTEDELEQPSGRVELNLTCSISDDGYFFVISCAEDKQIIFDDSQDLTLRGIYIVAQDSSGGLGHVMSYSETGSIVGIKDIMTVPIGTKLMGLTNCSSG